MDSPRGRIYLMGAGLEGEPLSESMVGHFDACLGCMACVTACPSGVQYDRLIETTRAQVERRYERPLRERVVRAAIFATFPYPKRLQLLRGPLRLYQRSGLQGLVRRSGLLDRVPGPLGAMESLAPPLGRGAEHRPLPERVAARGSRRATVGLLTGCVQGAFFPGVNAATARVLAMEGCDVVIPRNQGCCGALSVHNGREQEAKAFARRAIEVFEDASGRPRRRQRRRVRIVDEGVRRAVRRRAGHGGARRCPGRQGPRHHRGSGRAGAGGRPTSAADVRGLSRRVPPRTCPRRARATTRTARRHPRSRAARDRGPRAVLRLGRCLQPAQPRGRAAAR